mgnify:CR=1 FL=1|tara:strand:- start:923 stop:1120 length:198 start_codon:yes stop_codon:yes gene_type:complete
MSLKKIESRNDLTKNEVTGVIHYNINRNEMNRAREAKKNKKNEIENLKNEMSEMKDMLKAIMEKL